MYSAEQVAAVALGRARRSATRYHTGPVDAGRAARPVVGQADTARGARVGGKRAAVAVGRQRRRRCRRRLRRRCGSATATAAAAASSRAQARRLRQRRGGGRGACMGADCAGWPARARAATMCACPSRLTPGPRRDPSPRLHPARQHAASPTCAARSTSTCAASRPRSACSMSRRNESFRIEGPKRGGRARAWRCCRRLYDRAAQADRRPRRLQLALVEARAPGASAAPDADAGAADDGDAIVLHTRRADLAGRTPNQLAVPAPHAGARHHLRHRPGRHRQDLPGRGLRGRRARAQRVQRIVLTRPAVEAGERLGFLPGDLAQKVDPYLRPLYDALYDLMGFERVTKAFEKGLIEIAPLAFMRGRTLNHAFVILDEAQNTTREQMKMFLTRIGFGSKCVVTGDVSQIDLPHGARPAAWSRPSSVLRRVDGIAFTRFTVGRRGAPPAGGAHRRGLRARVARERASAATAMKPQRGRAARCRCSSPTPRTARSCRATRVARWIRAALRAPARDHGAHRRRRRRPGAEPRLPRQGLRDQRADLRLQPRAGGDRRPGAVRAGGRARGARRRASRWRRTTPTCWCTARCTRRATTTRRWREARAHGSARDARCWRGLGFADPYRALTDAAQGRCVRAQVALAPEERRPGRAHRDHHAEGDPDAGAAVDQRQARRSSCRRSR